MTIPQKALQDVIALVGLEAEIAQLREQLNFYHMVFNTGALDELRERAADAEADAARYRWLRSLPTGPGTSTIGDFHFTLAQHRPAPSRWCVDSVRGDALDAAIDAARAVPAQGGGRDE